ncbi:MAG: hypothetical protein N4A57_05840 [Anaeromicrobium sp.]|jgi:hypothetical protein|uniref:hypothetical protein n=1 Tax=Anaeromicrobium sp. TaxID=1929132 RepID=UPI0025E568AF|nr:hypothetical protein [Anaeromicrobium sp.]MCT4593774.1 hypothetical protein [Anaeromicrobium sp.]
MHNYYEYMEYHEKEAMKLYHPLYHKLYPYVRMVCAREDHIYNMHMQPFPRKEDFDRMVKEVKVMYEREGIKQDVEASRYGGGPLEALIGAFIITELLRRRRRRYRYNPYGSPYGSPYGRPYDDPYGY